MASRELITLTPVTIGRGSSGQKQKTLGDPIQMLAIGVDAPAQTAVEEATAVFNYDTEFRIRRVASVETVDKDWDLEARGVRWDIRRVRRFAALNSTRERWLGIQAVARPPARN